MFSIKIEQDEGRVLYFTASQCIQTEGSIHMNHGEGKLSIYYPLPGDIITVEEDS